MPPAPPSRRTAKATPPADDATVVVTFKGRKNCADTSVPITLVKHKEKWASHAYCPEDAYLSDLPLVPLGRLCALLDVC